MDEINGMSYAVTALGERIHQLEKDLHIERIRRENSEMMLSELETENRQLLEKLKAYVEQIEV